MKVERQEIVEDVDGFKEIDTDGMCNEYDIKSVSFSPVKVYLETKEQVRIRTTNDAADIEKEKQRVEARERAIYESLKEKFEPEQIQTP